MAKLNEILESRVPFWKSKSDYRKVLETEFMRYTGEIDIVELHIPYTRWDLMTKVLERKKKGRRILVSAGDAVNLDMFSFFHANSSDKSKPMDEINDLVKFFKVASEYYDKIIFMKTNHEMRVKKFLQKKMDKEQAEQYNGFVRPLDEMVRADGVNVVCAEGYLFQIGDLIVSHVENNSTTLGAVSRGVLDYFGSRVKSFNAIVQAHTHFQSKNFVERKAVVECGCMAETMDYWRRGKWNGKNKLSSIGYATGKMEKGRIDINSLVPVALDWEGWL